MTWAFNNSSNGIRYYNCTTNNDNTLTTASLQLNLDCTFTLPPSAEPTNFIFLFKRNGSSYLNLTAPLAAQAMAFSNSSKFVVGVSSYSAILSATYTLSVVLSQPLSSSGAIWVMLPPLLNFTNFMGISSCSATLNNTSLSLISCNYAINSTAALLMVNFNAASMVLSDSKIVLTITGLANPRSAYIAYPVGISTYYNTSLNSSLV